MRLGAFLQGIRGAGARPQDSAEAASAHTCVDLLAADILARMLAKLPRAATASPWGRWAAVEARASTAPDRALACPDPAAHVPFAVPAPETRTAR